jgi:DNA mismatch repair protein MutS
VVFLRRLVEGGASRSYGIQVARIAGLPAPVLRRARVVLENLEGGELDARGRPRLAADAGDPEPAAQLALFGERARDPRETAVLDALRALRTEETTPLEALAALARWQAALNDEEPS